MTDKPILFSGPMVRAILDGRKTQTRRIITRSNLMEWDGKEMRPIPVGFAPGDRLWVRETWQGLSYGDYLPTKSQVCDLRYAATDMLRDADKDVRGYPWRPSIHMPRWASRLTLIVEDVSVQRLQDITEADAQAEGAKPWTGAEQSYVTDFARIWRDAYGPEAWDANPWVAAITFRTIRANIDSPEAQND